MNFTFTQQAPKPLNAKTPNPQKQNPKNTNAPRAPLDIDYHRG